MGQNKKTEPPKWVDRSWRELFFPGRQAHLLTTPPSMVFQRAPTACTAQRNAVQRTACAAHLRRVYRHVHGAFAQSQQSLQHTRHAQHTCAVCIVTCMVHLHKASNPSSTHGMRSTPAPCVSSRACSSGGAAPAALRHSRGAGRRVAGAGAKRLHAAAMLRRPGLALCGRRMLCTVRASNCNMPRGILPAHRGRSSSARTQWPGSGR